ncbi:SRPBCC family protein [Cohnella sp. AR92]|uniref:SRPBCC family protein n=1 Tax=Cohnella sp. AR92 TaxID=648716 RepID=UPI000F8ECEFA|nr:SRPBCC family protein [Cohnella sp. AR92]RUS46751.1 hypothetical protein ELR57_13730 [Cohnella sp. AR92]
MWQFEHAIETKAKAEAIWRLYTDLTTWTSWHNGHIAEATLEGPFAVGSRGTMQPQGQALLPFELTEVEPLVGFADVTLMPGMDVEIRFFHDLTPTSNGLSIRHKVVIAGPDADRIGPKMIEHFSHAIPQNMETLAAMAVEGNLGHEG